MYRKENYTDYDH